MKSSWRIDEILRLLTVLFTASSLLLFSRKSIFAFRNFFTNSTSFENRQNNLLLFLYAFNSSANLFCSELALGSKSVTNCLAKQTFNYSGRFTVFTIITAFRRMKGSTKEDRLYTSRQVVSHQLSFFTRRIQ